MSDEADTDSGPSSNQDADRTARLLGVPLDLGANRRGVDMGPSAIRYADVAAELAAAGVDCIDDGDLEVPRLETSSPAPASGVNDSDSNTNTNSNSNTNTNTNSNSNSNSNTNAKYLDDIGGVTATLADAVAATVDDDTTPLVLGGDHAVAMGSMFGSGRGTDNGIGVIWFDAHGDYNTPATSPSGNVHGMPLAAAHGRGSFADLDWADTDAVSEENTVLVGIRSLDDEERAALRESEATVFTMREIDERGITAVVEDALEIATDGVDGIHVSLDLDWLDPTVVPGVGTPVRGGVNYREAHAALELVAERDREADILRSMDVVEVNPILDRDNQTAEVAAELAASAFGKRIL
ncbi:arginase [Natrialba magadii ATCC 43099]|uniref:Arginase n=1 Tax=Natrialba magadii (strain ATCC 43099 / DSM 3394 / CCM 3739 / CIP 104546 / IAM 13178 / JCM 8861 / NBRC 102185 / NCIMB 2190 / MS3) TaxID=547559 RepID=D3T035_NATMM|nr:arginase [Natrialba magadii]ADD04393.1 arginase [Natrialba magadii ATCC 43099]ELY25789.1 arginase [Natrialba magadii ATCC 43099]